MVAIDEPRSTSSLAAIVHPTAVVSSSARLGAAVVIGPYSIVAGDVTIGARTHLVGSCVVTGPTTLGSDNVLHPFCVLGSEPQDRSYRGEATRLVVGDRNVFREHVTVHRGTMKDRATTTVGSDSLFMVGAHVAHDVTVGDGVTLTNNVMIGGHVTIGDHVVIAAGVGVAPFVRVGETAFIAAGAMVESDIPPYVIASGDRARVRALNRVGLARRGAPASSRAALSKAFRLIFRGKTTRARAIELVRSELGGDPFVATLVRFFDLAR